MNNENGSDLRSRAQILVGGKISHVSAKPESVVFGVAIGSECVYKTPAEAFNTRLYELISAVNFRRLDANKKQVAQEELQEFCNEWYKDPNLTESERKSLLGVALVRAKHNRKRSMLEAVEDQKSYNEWDLVQNGWAKEQEYPSGDETMIYNTMINTIDRMMDMQKEKGMEL